MPEAQFMSAQEREAFEMLDRIESLKAPAEIKTQYDEKLDELIDSFQSTPNATVSIYRQKGNNVNDGLTFLDSFPPDKYTREQIMKLLRDEYGTGDYRVQVRVKGKLKANELICIEAPKKPEHGSRSETSDIIETVLTRLDRMQQQMFNTPQKSPEQIEHDFLQKMLVMKQLFGQPQQSNGGLQEMLTLITGLKSAGLISTPNDEKDVKESDGFMGFLSSMAPTLETIAKGAMQPRQQIPQQMPPAYHPQPAPQPEPDLTGEPDGLPEHVKALVSMALITLCNAADKQSDSEFYADWVLDQMPDEHLSEFVAMLEADNWLDTLDAMSYGKAKPHAVWFEELRQQIFAQLVPDDSGQTDNNQERQSGND